MDTSSYISYKPTKTITKPVMNETVQKLMKKVDNSVGHKTVGPLKGRRELKRDRRAQRDQTKGSKWFDMSAPELTTEIKNDLSVVQMRKALDPKRFYKNNDIGGLPKYFQMGKVVESPADFYHARIVKKKRKANIVEELLADAEFKKNFLDDDWSKWINRAASQITRFMYGRIEQCTGCAKQDGELVHNDGGHFEYNKRKYSEISEKTRHPKAARHAKRK